jgi:hypothetical protein
LPNIDRFWGVLLGGEASKVLFFLPMKTPGIDSAGVKNHHLEMKSTPPQFFARADFDPAGLFWGN